MFSSCFPELTESMRMFRALFPLLLFASITTARAGYSDPALSVKIVSTAGNANQPILVMPSSGSASATLMATATNFSPASYSWSQVTPGSLNNSLAANATATLSATTTAAPQVTVTLPAAGVYQFQVSATNGSQSASQFVWVQVWDALSGLKPLYQVGRNPGIAPPTSVRQFSPDPGPYCHPRLFFSRVDWPELNAKTTAAGEVSSAIAGLQSALNGNFDQAGAVLNNYAGVLVAYADGGYDAAYLSATVQPFYTANASAISGSNLLGRSPNSNFPDALLAAAYLAWVGTDPTLAQSAVPLAAQNRFRYLAKLTAAAAKVELAVQASSLTTNFANAQKLYDLAVVYDLLYDWMAPQQQNDTRDYLYVIGYGVYNGYYGGISRTYPGPVPFGKSMNGDFPNLADGFILPALAVEGEESSVSASVQATYGVPVAAATGPNAWSNASPASVNNLYRECRWLTDGYVTLWGTPVHHHGYFELSMAFMSPSTLALARRGQNQFVTTTLYQASLSAFNNLYARESDGKPVLWDHHDSLGFGNGPNSNNGRYILKYMFPDDPMVDYTHRAFRNEGGNNLAQAMFGVSPGAQNLATVAQNKNLPLTRFDPMGGTATTRNSWLENDLQLYFECRPDTEGHMHAEANNFSLYANGRAWSSPPGYHCAINDLAASVLIQNPSLASDPATQGYIGESPSSGTISTTRGQFPTPPGKFLEATEDPAGQWTLFAGDASSAYNNAFENTGTDTDTGQPLLSFYYNGVQSALPPGFASTLSGNLTVKSTAYNPVQYALRTVFSVRGARPYVLVLDDITADGTPRNYRWNMPAAVSFGGSGGRFVNGSNNSVYSSMAIQSGATATDSVLYHSPIDDGSANGKPRLLVRDVTEQSTSGQPAIILDKRPSGFAGGNLTYGFDNNSGQFTYVPSSRLLITRQNVVSPQFKVLLFPYLTGDATPATSWDASQNMLSINLQNGFTDKITLDKTSTDHRTRVVALSRTKSGRTAPTLNLPTNLVLPPNATAFNGQPGGTGTFTVTATDDLGGSLTPSVSSPSGTVFPVGVNVVKVTATDALGQVSSGQFTVTVTPAAPTVTVTSVTNLPGGTSGITLNWTNFYGATAYSVKRATTPGGPYTVISDRQTGTTFTDSGLIGTSYYYVVTAWLNNYEGPNSAEIPLAGNATPFTGQIIGTGSPGFGFYKQGSTYLLTCTGGQIGGSSDQTASLTIPWNGDGAFSARIVSVTGQGGSVSQFGNYGVFMRQSTTANDLMTSSAFNTYVSPLQFIYRSTPGGAAASSGPFSSTGLYPAPVWLRLVRSGNTLTASYSFDGINFIQTAAPQTINFTATTLIGIAAGGQNSTLTSVLFDNLVFLGTPTAAVSGNNVALSWQGFPGLTYSLQRATSAAGPFTMVASGLAAATFSDPTVTQGTTYYYTVSTTGADGGATTSPAVSVLFPAPVVAPTNLTLTPGVGQITLNWTGSPPETTPTYSVQRAISAGGPYVTVASGLTATTYTDSGFQNGATYFYRIVADNGRGPAASPSVSGAGSSGTFTKANNTTSLDIAGSWSPVSIPGAGDVILWNGTYANGTASVGAGISVSQFQMTSPSAAVTINAGTGPLALGAGGLDLSTSTQNLTVNAPVSLTASQTWTVKSGLTATINGNITESAAGTAFTKSGVGILALAGPANLWTGITAVSGGILQIGNSNAVGFLPGATIASGAMLRFQTTSSGSISGSVDGAGTLNQNSTTGVITLYQPAGTRTLGAVTGVSGGVLILSGDPGANTTTSTNLNNGGFTVKFIGGNWTLNGGGGYATNLEVSGGTVLRPASTGDFNNIAAFTIHGGQFTSANNYGMRMGSTYGANNNSGSNFIGVQDGGTVVVSGSDPELGSASANINASYTLSGGLFSVTNGHSLRLGAATTGTGTTTFTLSGGKLLHSGAIQGMQGAGAVQVFAFTGGTLATAAFNATNLQPTAADATGALVQSGGILAPGDVGTAGRTQITGNYTLGASATLALDVGGTTPASGFQSGGYDYLTVSGTTTLAGNLSVSLNNFTPSNATTFTVLNSTGTLSGAFANVAFGQRLVTAGGEGTFLVSKVANTVTLSGYTPLTALQAWRWRYFATIANSGVAADLADPANDGFCNLLEYALHGTPLAFSPIAPVAAINAQGFLQLTFYRAASDVTYIVQGSDDLKSWTDIITNPGTVGQNVTIQSAFHFMRLKVTNP